MTSRPTSTSKGYVDRVVGMEKVSARLLFSSTWFVLDIFLATTPFLHSVMQPRARVPFQDAPVFVVTAADLILLKLIADGARTGSTSTTSSRCRGCPSEPTSSSGRLRSG
jgi:hypothetical protein